MQGRQFCSRDDTDEAHAWMRSAQPADHVHLDPSRQAGWQGRDDNCLISPPSSELIIDGKHRIGISDPGINNVDPVPLKCLGGRLRASQGNLLRVAFVPDQQVANWGGRNEQSEPRLRVIRGQVSCRIYELLSLRRLMSNQ